MNQADPDVIEEISANLLIQNSRNPTSLIGQPKVNLQRDFEFRRGLRPSHWRDFTEI
jgi:hypothetical protein